MEKVATEFSRGMDDEVIREVPVRLEEATIPASRLVSQSCVSCKSEEVRLNEVLQLQSKRLEDEINDIKKTASGRMTRIFKLKQKIVGNKKAGQEPTAIKDPETGDV